MKTLALVAFALAAGSTLACGSLGDPGKKPVLATITGELQNTPTSTVSPSSGSGTRVAVVWLGLSNNYSVALDLAVQPVFPSRFQLTLSDPPPDDVVLTAAKVPKEPAVKPPGPLGPSPTPAPPSAGGAKPKDLDQNVGSWPADFGYAVGSVVAYDDQNGNGRLDLVDDGATAYVDRILGANESLLLFYFQGTFPPDIVDTNGTKKSQYADMGGQTPRSGYNLLYLKECNSVATLDGTNGAPAPAAPPCTPAAQWLPIESTLYTLPLTGDPTWGNLMCRKGSSEFGASSGSSSEAPSSPGSDGSGRPPPTNLDAGADAAVAPDPSLPAAGDPKLQCSADGRSFTYDCHPTPPPPPKLCGGPQIAEAGCGAWIRPNPPPPNWPCPGP